MISFELTEEQRIVQATVASFAAEVLRPEMRKLDTASSIDTALLASLWDMGIIQTQAEADSSAVTNAIILEELAAGDASAAVGVAASIGFVRAVLKHGSERQAAEVRSWLAGPNFRISALATMEAHFGFDITSIKTTASKSADGYRLSGRKIMVPIAGQCDYFLVIAQCQGALDGFIVPRESPNVEVSPAKGTLGLHAAQLADVTFTDTVVPAAMRLGESNGADIQTILDSARVGTAAILTGLGRSVLEYVVPYVKERVVHGTPLAQKQKIAFDIADMRMDVEAMRWTNWKAAWAHDAGAPTTKISQLAYTFAASQSMQIADNGVQAFGGHGYVRSHPIELWYRDVRSLSALEGAVGV